MQRGQLTEALDQFTNAIQADYSYANAFLKRAMIYQMQGRYREAEMDYNQALQLNPNAALLYDQRGRLKLLAKDYTGALEDHNTAIKLKPNDLTFIDHRLDGYYALGNYNLLLSALDEMIAASPKDEVLHEKKARVL